MKMPKGVPLWPIVQLTQYFRNPRLHSQDQVVTMARLMERFGWTDPIIVDEALGILAGHLRYAAAIHLGLQEVPVIEVTHLSKEEKRAFVISHNSIALKSRWNEPALSGELHDIEDEELRVLAGFNDADLAAIDARLDSFEPALAPEAGHREVDAGDMERAQDHLEDQSRRRQYLSKVVCPHCGEEFYLDQGGNGAGGSGTT